MIEDWRLLRLFHSASPACQRQAVAILNLTARRMRRCAWCRKFFEVGGGKEDGVRADRKTCSQNCRTYLWRQRKKERKGV